MTHLRNVLSTIIFMTPLTQFTPPCVNSIGDKKSRLSATENFETILSSVEMRRGLLKTVLTCRQYCSHRQQDKTRVRVGGVN